MPPGGRQHPPEQVDLPAEIARRVPQTFSLLMRKE